jgi:hypothetical protein
MLRMQQGGASVPSIPKAPEPATGLGSILSQGSEPPMHVDQCMPVTYPTPSATQPGSTSHESPGSATSNCGDDLSPAEAEEALRNFQDKYLPWFPFVYIRPGTTAQDLQRDRPFLWLNIRTACEKSTAKMHALGDKIREVLARKAFVDLERNLDLLMGIIAYLAW